MSEPRVTTSHLTTLWGGAGIVLASLITLLASFGAVIPVSDEYIFPFRGAIPSMVSAVIFLVAIVILAFGIRGESGIVGGSVIGKVALLVFGVGGLVLALTGLLSDSISLDAAIGLGGSRYAISIVTLIASVVAAIMVARAHVLTGYARWALVVVAAWDVFLTAIFTAPLIRVAYALAELHTDVIRPLLIIALGIAYLLHGQTAAIRQRLHVINEKW